MAKYLIDGENKGLVEGLDKATFLPDGALPIEYGGTGAKTIQDVREVLGISPGNWRTIFDENTQYDIPFAGHIRIPVNDIWGIDTLIVSFYEDEVSAIGSHAEIGGKAFSLPRSGQVLEAQINKYQYMGDYTIRVTHRTVQVFRPVSSSEAGYIEFGLVTGIAAPESGSLNTSRILKPFRVYATTLSSDAT